MGTVERSEWRGTRRAAAKPGDEETPEVDLRRGTKRHQMAINMTERRQAPESCAEEIGEKIHPGPPLSSTRRRQTSRAPDKVRTGER
jgi:hypothetical protein